MFAHNYIMLQVQITTDSTVSSNAVFSNTVAIKNVAVRYDRSLAVVTAENGALAVEYQTYQGSEPSEYMKVFQKTNGHLRVSRLMSHEFCHNDKHMDR